MDYSLLLEVGGGCIAVLAFCAWREYKSEGSTDYRYKRWFDFR